MDHPGFNIERRVEDQVFEGKFEGGVGAAYFKEGVKVRFHPGAVPGVLVAKREHGFTLRAESDCDPRFAVWDLPDHEVVGDLLRARVCDDLVGVGTVLAVLIELAKTGHSGSVIGLLSRAEEVGFHGALVAANDGAIPRDALVISLETSREMPPVKMGEGVIVRVGDRASVFDPDASRFLGECAAAVAQRDPGFRWQRALMSGGTCEGTAYQQYGYRTAAVCVALGNYHNCGPENVIDSEFVQIPDVVGMSALLIEAARSMSSYEEICGKLRTRLQGYLSEARGRAGAGGFVTI
jgi:hypothetical protein